MSDGANPDPGGEEPTVPLGGGPPRIPGLAKQGDAIGPFKIVSLIGEGGFGVVYCAEQTTPVKRRVALKIIKPGMDTRQVIARFESERQALAMMDHPGIARVYEAGATPEGRPWFAMELVRGESITEYCDRQKLDTSARLRLFADLCDAVQHAHQKGVIHRDLKPGNVLVTIDNRDTPQPKVIDFGIAKAMSQQLTEKTIFTEQGQLIGTPEYMSPEQAEMSAVDVDTRSDVYSLGVILYELLSSRVPFDPKMLRSKGFAEIQRIIREEDPPKPSTKLTAMEGEEGTRIAEARKTKLAELQSILRKELEWIPLKALRKERTERYGTAAAMGEDVRRYLAGEPLEAGPESMRYRVGKFVRRNKGPVAAVAAMAVILLAGIVGTTLFALRAAAEAERVRISERETDRRRAEAVEMRDLAQEQTEKARMQQGKAERGAYLAGMRAAVTDLMLHEYDEARSGIDRTPESERGWEWAYLAALLQKPFQFAVPRPHSEMINVGQRLVIDPVTKVPVTLTIDATTYWDAETGQPLKVLPHAPRPDDVSGSTYFLTSDGPRRIDIMPCDGELSEEQLSRFQSFIYGGYERGRGNCLVISDAMTGEEVRRVGVVQDDLSVLGGVLPGEKYVSVMCQADRPGGSVIVDLDSGEIVNLGADYYEKPTPSPDGRLVAFGDSESRESGGFIIREVVIEEIISRDRVVLEDSQSMDVLASEPRKKFSPDGRYLAAINADGEVGVWDTRLGGGPRTYWSTESHGKGPNNAGYSLTWSSDGRKLATSGNNQIRVWDVHRGTLLRTIPFGGGVVFSASGDDLFSWSKGAIRVLNAAVPEVLAEGWADINAHVSELLGDQVVSCGPLLVVQDYGGTLHLFDVMTRDQLFWTRFQDPLQMQVLEDAAIAASPGGRHLARFTIEQEFALQHIDGRKGFVHSVSEDPPIMGVDVLDTATGSEIRLDIDIHPESSPQCFAWCGPDRLLYWGGDDQLHAWRPSTGTSEVIDGPGDLVDGTPWFLSASDDGRFIAMHLAGWTDQDAQQRGHQAGFEMIGSMKLHSSKFVPERTGLFYLANDGSLSPLSVTNSPPQGRTVLFRPGYSYSDLAAGPPGRPVRKSRAEKSVLVYCWPTSSGDVGYGWLFADGPDRKKLSGFGQGTFVGISSPTTAMAFTPDGSRLATGHKSGTIRFWDMKTKECTLVLRGEFFDAPHQPVNSLDFTDDGTQLVVSHDGVGSRVRVLDTLSVSERSDLIEARRNVVAEVRPTVERFASEPNQHSDFEDVLTSANFTDMQRDVARIEMLKRARPLRSTPRSAYFVVRHDKEGTNRWHRVSELADSRLPADIVDSIATLLRAAPMLTGLGSRVAQALSMSRSGDHSNAMQAVQHVRDRLQHYLASTDLEYMDFLDKPHSWDIAFNRDLRGGSPFTTHGGYLYNTRTEGLNLMAWLVVTEIHSLMQAIRSDQDVDEREWNALSKDLNTLALEMAQEVVTQKPTWDYLKTLGVAEYRNGLYGDAVESIRRSAGLLQEDGRQPDLGNTAILAMAAWQLGEHERARVLLDECRQLSGPRSVRDLGKSDGERFYEEARSLIGGTP